MRIEANHTDDAEPVDEAWLRSIGFDTDIRGVRKRYTLRRLVLAACPPLGESGWYWSLGVGQVEFLGIPAPQTRGDVRHLAAALGVGLREDM